MWKNIWPAVTWAILVLILCGFPGDKLPELTFLEWLKPDKIVHLILFGVQCYLLLRGFARQDASKFLQKHGVTFSVVLTIIFGCLVEVMQTYIFIHRTGDVRDAAANTLGAFIGLWIYRRSLRVKSIPHES